MIDTKNDNIHKKLKLFRALIIFAMFVLVMGIVVLFFVKMEDSVYATGKLVGINDYSMRSPVSGKITELCKEEGAALKKGDIIIKLDTTELEDKIAMLKCEIAEIEAEITVKKIYYEVLYNNPLPKEYRHVETEYEESKKKLEQGERNLATYKELYEKKAISRIEYEKQELVHILDQTSLQKSKDDLERVRQGMGEKILKQAQNEISLLEVKLNNKRNMLKIMQKHIVDYEIVAPEDGIVTELPLPAWHYVEKGDIIAKMSYVKQKKYLAYVSENYIYKIRLDQNVKIRSSQYNYMNFGLFDGTVIKVSELPVKADGRNLYPVEILVTKEPYELKLGSSAQLMISTGRERIIICLLGLND